MSKNNKSPLWSKTIEKIFNKQQSKVQKKSEVMTKLELWLDTIKKNKRS